MKYAKQGWSKFKEYFDIFVFIMDKINEKVIDKLFEKYQYPSIEFDNLETNLQLFENNIIEIKKRSNNFTKKRIEIEFSKFLIIKIFFSILTKFIIKIFN